jgi:hypothetical protein
VQQDATIQDIWQFVTYRDDFYFIDRLHCSTFPCYWCASSRYAQTNSSDESACLTTDNLRNEGKEVTWGLLGGNALHSEQRVSYAVIYSKFISSGRQLSAQVAVRFQLQAVSCEASHGALYNTLEKLVGIEATEGIVVLK